MLFALLSALSAQAIPVKAQEALDGKLKQRELAVAQNSVNQRQSAFSSFSIGASLIDYEESPRLTVDGRVIDVETDLGAIPTQSSNAFVAIDRRWGFYLFSVSTLGVPRSTELWQIDEQIVRTNRVSFEQQSIGVLGSRRWRSNYQWLFGARYSKLEFKRFSASLTPESANFGITADTFSDGTVSETVWDISVLLGFEKSTLFLGDSNGWQYQWQVTVAVPLTSSLSNTEVEQGRAFSDSFNGYGVRLSAVLGFRFTTNFLIGASLQVQVLQRYALEQESSSAVALTAFPENRTVSVLPAIGAYWSF